MEYSDKIDIPYKYDAWCKTVFRKSEKYTFVWSISVFISRTEKSGKIAMILFLYIYLAKQIAIETVDAGGVLCSLDVNRVQQKIDQFANVKKGEF